jgi:hypothetical protein
LRIRGCRSRGSGAECRGPGGGDVTDASLPAPAIVVVIVVIVVIVVVKTEKYED